MYHFVRKHAVNNNVYILENQWIGFISSIQLFLFIKYKGSIPYTLVL